MIIQASEIKTTSRLTKIMTNTFLLNRRKATDDILSTIMSPPATASKGSQTKDMTAPVSIKSRMPIGKRSTKKLATGKSRLPLFSAPLSCTCRPSRNLKLHVRPSGSHQRPNLGRQSHLAGMTLTRCRTGFSGLIRRTRRHESNDERSGLGRQGSSCDEPSQGQGQLREQD